MCSFFKILYDQGKKAADKSTSGDSSDGSFDGLFGA